MRGGGDGPATGGPGQATPGAAERRWQPHTAEPRRPALCDGDNGTAAEVLADPRRTHSGTSLTLPAGMHPRVSLCVRSMQDCTVPVHLPHALRPLPTIQSIPGLCREVNTSS